MIVPERIKSLWPRNHCWLYIKPLQKAFNGGILLGKQGIVEYLQRYSWMKKKEDKISLVNNKCDRLFVEKKKNPPKNLLISCSFEALT